MKTNQDPQTGYHPNQSGPSGADGCKNRKLNRPQLAVVLTLLGLLAVLAPVSFRLYTAATSEAEEKERVEVRFSVPSGFYEEEILLQLSAGVKGEILYTLDGSVPAGENPAAMPYSPEEGIRLECGPKERIYHVRAALWAETAVEADVSSASYLLGGEVGSRYDLPVLAIAGNPEDLSDAESGILAAANRSLRGRETEKEVQITLFDETGAVRLSQNCGLRVHGGASREKNQPSMRLYARSEYDEENRFACALFEDYSQDHALITGCKRVIVRNAGDDNGYAHLRSEFAARLSLDAGFSDAQAASPVCVYVNGDYYGVYWFVANYDDSYFQRKYGDFEGEMVVLEGYVSYMEPEETDDETLRQLKEEYNALHERAAYGDLTQESEWQALCASVDVENYLRYVAIQNYFCNADAFVNNFKAYRYYAPDGAYREGTVFDGRYRFLLYDLDETLGYGVYGGAGAEARIFSTANRVEYDIFYNALFSNIVSVPAGREYYIRYYLSLLNYYFQEQRAVPVLEEMHESHAAELAIQYDETDLMQDNFETPEDVDFAHVLSEIDTIKAFLAERPDWALLDLEAAFGLSKRYELRVKNPDEANLSVDFAVFHDTEYHGTYFAEVPVTVTASPKCGDRFVCWLVDGVECYEETLVVTGEMLQGEALELECVTEPDPEAGLLISAVKSRGGSDYIELTNFGAETVNLREYTLADGAGEQNLSTLPAVEVAPGERIRVYCKNYTGAEAIGQPEAGFNIKAGETLYLRRGGFRQEVAVPRLGTRDGVYRMDVYSGEFYEKTE
ncbi:MAG: CotH kinase family protein [Muribaculum sp.]|nr:CotH kinase family protein [Muribaculum sp.]